MRIFIGLLIVIISIFVVIKTNWLVQNFGYMAWAERFLGIFGGTRTVIKVIAVFATFIGFLYLTNQMDAFLNFAFGWLVPDSFKGVF